MRTTVTLDPDVELIVKRLMRRRGLTFKQALNEAVRAGVAAEAATPAPTPTYRMGFDPAVGWDKALALAGELEDEELVRRIAVRK